MAADAVRGAGRYGDDLVVHVNRREFEDMVQRWGEPAINPDTGLPEFFLDDLWDDAKDTWNDVKEWVVPVGAAAAGAFLPGIGNAIGSVLPGVASVLGPVGTQALGAGLLGAGAGYLANGGQGALWGGLGGALGAYGGDFLSNGWEGTAGQALTALGGLGGAAGTAGGEGAGMGNGAIAPALLMAALNGIGGYMQSDPAGEAAAAANDDAQAQFDQELPEWQNKRRRRQYSTVPDYTQEGEREYFDYNSLEGEPQRYAEGGVPHGRSDNIKALLSPGEYVIDAETVALLGNGSTEAGAAKLERLRQNIRKHKGSALAQGQISPDALPAEQYI